MSSQKRYFQALAKSSLRTIMIRPTIVSLASFILTSTRRQIKRTRYMSRTLIKTTIWHWVIYRKLKLHKTSQRIQMLIDLHCVNQTTLAKNSHLWRDHQRHVAEDCETNLKGLQWVHQIVYINIHDSSRKIPPVRNVMLALIRPIKIWELSKRVRCWTAQPTPICPYLNKSTKSWGTATKNSKRNLTIVFAKVPLCTINFRNSVKNVCKS